MRWQSKLFPTATEAVVMLAANVSVWDQLRVAGHDVDSWGTVLMRSDPQGCLLYLGNPLIPADEVAGILPGFEMAGPPPV